MAWQCTCLILAWLKRRSVTIPAIPPVRDWALTAFCCKAMATSAAETCSPVLISISSSRPSGATARSPARSSKWSVVWPIADTTTITSQPWSCSFTFLTIFATCLMRWVSITDVPPNLTTILFILMPLVVSSLQNGAVSRDKDVITKDLSKAGQFCRPGSQDFVQV